MGKVKKVKVMKFLELTLTILKVAVRGRDDCQFNRVI